MAKGRKPLPTGIKLLRGNPGKRAINHAEPKVSPSDHAPPSGLAGRAKKVWQEMAPDLIAAGVLKVSDRPVFRVYCELVADTEKMTRLVAKVGPEVAVSQGYARRLDSYRKQLREYSAVLGLNPSARSTIKIPPAEPKTDTTADFLFGGAKRG